MKRTLVLLTVLGWTLAGTPRVEAGDREWATAGKILTGVIAGAALVHALQPPPVVAAPAPVVCAPAPPPVVVVPAPVVVAPPPRVCPPPVTVVYPAPVVVRPVPVVAVHVHARFSRGPHRHCR
ncbi:hypothetical protein [Limisphaera sp. VF-2]|jgi:hypothetical protein|uniref:hypothetical protein n=1 Tax=Limisphaera sp. VF-2 TaxID=3400418 RepID=UPI001778FD7B|nr:hypothetical protein [Limisphaera sp.]